MATADAGLIGLAVMGRNLALNLADYGYQVAVYNRTDGATETLAAAHHAITGCATPSALVAALKRPRVILLMVQAGVAVDAVITTLVPLLEAGDILVDGGNSHFRDTERRCRDLHHRGLLFVGAGVSGGEEGARRGPSIMPGGDVRAWPRVRPMLQAIAARADSEPCCRWLGDGGAGHFVKMIHNGIEYGNMQLLCEAWQLLRDGLGLDTQATRQVFEAWNEGVLNSFLMEITAAILGHKDQDGTPLVDHILDTAAEKGTGKWAAISALEQGVPLTIACEAVFARRLSAMKDQRLQAAARLRRPVTPFSGDRDRAVAAIGDGLYAAQLISFAQGFMVLKAAAQEQGWELDYGGIAHLWQGGCIIRSGFLGDIRAAFALDPGLHDLLLDDHFANALLAAEPGWRQTVQLAVQMAIPAPAFCAALGFFDGYRSARLPANLLQAQRDYFGAHAYERTDRPRGEFFHTQWTGNGPAPDRQRTTKRR